MRNLSEIIKELTEARIIANAKLEDFPARSRPGIEMQQRNAVDKIKDLENEYKNTVLSNFIVIGVHGTNCKEFAVNAASKGIVIADYNCLNDRILKALKEANARDTLSKQEFEMITGEVIKIKHDYKIDMMPNIFSVNLVNYEGLPISLAVKVIIHKVFDNQLTSVMLRSDIAENALKAGFTGKIAVAFLYNFDEKVGVDPAFIPNPSQVINTSDMELDNINEYVEQSLAKIKKALSPKQKSQKKESETNE